MLWVQFTLEQVVDSECGKYLILLIHVHVLSFVGKACRARVFKNLCHQFTSPLEAEQHFKNIKATEITATPSQTPVPGAPCSCHQPTSHLDLPYLLPDLSHVIDLWSA